MKINTTPGQSGGKEAAAPDPTEQYVPYRKQQEIGEQGALHAHPVNEVECQARRDRYLKQRQSER